MIIVIVNYSYDDLLINLSLKDNPIYYNKILSEEKIDDIIIEAFILQIIYMKSNIINYVFFD